MNRKYLSKALLFQEKKNIIISMLTHSFVLVIPILVFISRLKNATSEDRMYNSDMLINGTSCFLMGIICLTTIFYSYNNKESQYSFMFTQPYSRDSIIITRTIAYMISYTIPLIAYGFISSILIYTNQSVLEDNLSWAIGSINSKVFITFVILTLIVMLVQLMQMLFGKNIVTGVFSVLIPVIGLLELEGIYQVTSKKIPYLKSILGHILDSFEDFRIIMDKYLEGNSYSGLSIIFIIISAIIFYSCVLLNRKVQTENMSGLFMFKFSEYIVRFIFSMLIVALFSMVVVIGITFLGMVFNINLFLKINQGLNRSITEMYLLIIDIVCTILTVIVYKLLGKIADKRRLG